MEGAEAAIEENLSCPICTEVLRDPKTLQCLHNFCASCLQKYLDSSAQHDKHVMGIKCPSCREETQVPDPSRPLRQWVSQLRTNCIIRNTIEEGLHRPSDRDCDICRGDDRNIQAVVQCTQCQLTFCQSCILVHKMIPTCKDHHVKRIAASIPPVKHECYNFKISLETNSSSSQRKKMSQRVKREISSKIDDICKRGVENIKQKEKQFTADAAAVVDEVFEKFDSLYPVFSADESSDLSSSDDLDEEDGKEAVATIKLSSKVESFINSSYRDSLASARTTLDFKETGHLRLAPSDSNDPGMETIEVTMDDLEDSESDDEDEMEEFSHCHVVKTDCKLEDEYDPWIKSILVMESCDMETILVTDENNRCVKSFYTDEGGSCHSSLKLSGKPWGLTELKNERIVVTCPDEKSILTVRVSPELKTVSKNKVKEKLFSVATVDADSVIACGQDEHPPALHIVNLKGNILKTIAQVMNKYLFKSPTCITTSPRGYYLVAEKMGQVLHVTKAGLVSTRKSLELQSPLQWIACSHDGKVYIVDTEGNNVVWVREGRDNVTVLTGEHGILFPVCVCRYMDALFVVERMGMIKKFKLSTEN
ncbi:uncharacterized protein [Haliotis asinina]|uniref:uncharacterized protein n=1 Tax=Haliotis asinina TaxID=109174 RepID=UPI00353246B7